MNKTTGELQCVCFKGFFGAACEHDCLCNRRSACKTRGVCLQCEEGYTGSDCGTCMDGYYKFGGGCNKCQCNDNGDPSQGLCDKNDGKCFCVNNTAGLSCEKCLDGFYLRRSESGIICYKQCGSVDAIFGVRHMTMFHIGSEEGIGASNPEQISCFWKLSNTELENQHTPAISGGLKITFEITAINVNCEQQFVYVYENEPAFVGEGSPGDTAMTTDNHQREKILGAFCGTSNSQRRVIEAETTITVVFRANVSQGNQFFRARVIVHKQPCTGFWQPRGEEFCECPNNMTGWNCDQVTCPNKCGEDLKQGKCVSGDDDKFICRCNEGYKGSDCSQKSTSFDTDHFTTLLKGTFGREAKYGRYGHTMVADREKKNIYIIGGRNFVANPVDMLKYSIGENTLTDVRTDFLIIPYRGYYHASAITDENTVYVFGGLQQTDHKCSRTFWHFIPDAKTQNDKLEVSHGAKDDFPAYTEPGHSWIPTVAQHTMNYVNIKGEKVLVIIGGYSPEHGFNNYTLLYTISAKSWSQISNRGEKPTGIFGHSTVFHEPSSTFYIFGGYIYSKSQVRMSNELYAMKFVDINRPARWDIVYPRNLRNKLSAIVYHEAVIVEDNMLILGGRTESEDFTNDVRIYQILCNSWIIEGDTIAPNSLLGSRFEPVIGHSAVAIDNDIYIYGGFNGITFQSMHKLTLPKDLCSLMHGSSESECERISGCFFCDARKDGKNACGGLSKCCFSKENLKGSCIRGYGRDSSRKCHSRNEDKRSLRAECSQHHTCGQCLSQYEKFSPSKCTWCSGASTCVSSAQQCPIVFKTGMDPNSRTTVTELSKCEQYHEFLTCMHSDCAKCQQNPSCVWSRHLGYTADNTAMIKIDTENTKYNWGCFPRKLLEVAGLSAGDGKHAKCPPPCHSYENCSACLKSGGGDGGWKQCYWAQDLNECISPTFAAVQCAAGECGKLVRESSEGCPKVCEELTQCSTCLSMTHCGWCSLQSSKDAGFGACWEGGVKGPRQQRCTSDSVISHLLSWTTADDKSMGPNILSNLRGHQWSHGQCPAENECETHHHNCNDQNEQCKDLDLVSLASKI